MRPADSLRAYIDARPRMFARIDLHVRDADFEATCRCGYLDGPAPLWGGQGRTAEQAIDQAAAAALDYWSWCQAVGHV